MKPMTEYKSFREGLKEVKDGKVAIREDYVMIPRKQWDESQKKVQRILEYQKAVYGRPN